MYAQRKSLLDVFPFDPFHLGVYRESFDRVAELAGFELTPVEGATEMWNFRNLKSGQRGRLLDVAGFLSDAPVALSTRGRAYMVTRQDFTLALLFPGAPWRIKLSQAKYKVVTAATRPQCPNAWPEKLVTRVIRFRFRNIVIVDEEFLLQQIGLRGSLHPF